MPGYIGGDYNMAGIKWIGSGPQNYKRGLPRASVTVILNDPDTKLPVCIADGTAVSAKRTGASGGIAARELSVRNASVMLILLGKKPARETDDEIIYFNAVGSGLMDIAPLFGCPVVQLDGVRPGVRLRRAVGDT